MGLLALMLLQESRRAARTSPSGEIVLLEDQDRTLWDRAMIAEGVALTERALKTRMFGPYCLQAAIAAVHAEAPSTKETDWSEIIGLYDVLARLDPSPVVALNRAVAVAMRDGPALALPTAAELLKELPDYHLAYAVRGPLPAPRQEQGRPRLLSQSARARAPGARAPFSRTAHRRPVATKPPSRAGSDG